MGRDAPPDRLVVPCIRRRSTTGVNWSPSPNIGPSPRRHSQSEYGEGYPIAGDVSRLGRKGLGWLRATGAPREPDPH